MKKTITQIISLIIFIFGCFVMPQLGIAESDSASSEFESCILSNGTVKITKYLGTSTNVLIPDMIDGVPVSQIGSEAFQNCIHVEKIEIPDTVIYIDDYAFRGCNNLAEIIIPESTRNIGSNPFVGCTKLEQINIAKSNSGLKVQNGTLFSIPDCRLVAYLYGNTDVTYNVPTDTLHIGDSAFWGNTHLKEIVMPDGLISIGSSAFAQCAVLTQISIPDNVKRISTNMFEGCFSLSEVSLPQSANIIGYGAFDDCYCLSKVNIPEESRIIIQNGSYADSEAFCIDHNIAYQYLKIDDKLFANETSTIKTDKNFEYAVCSRFVAITKYIGSSKKVVIPETMEGLPVYTINHEAFMGQAIEEIIFPDTLRTIGTDAFSGCNMLKEVTIPSSVTSISGYAFSNCKELQRINIHGSTGLKLCYGAFSGCTNLRYVSITGCDYVVMHDRLFADCPNLEDVNMSNTVWERSDYLSDCDLFKNCDRLNGITISTNCDWNTAKEFCWALQIPYRYDDHLDWIVPN